MRCAAGHGTNTDHKDIMSLAGLLTILDADPQLHDVVARAGEELTGAELTPFEQSALRAAATIPPGEVRSYGWVARAIGQPTAVRAVGRAMARNPVALLYPCHRVVDANGALHQYAYGVEVKARLLEMEGYPTAGVAVAAGPSTR